MVVRKGVAAAAIAVSAIIIVAGAAGAYVFVLPLLKSATQNAPCISSTEVISGTVTTTTSVLCDASVSSNGGGGGGSGGNGNGGGGGGLSSQGSSSESTNTSQLETFRVHFSWSGQTTAGNTTDVQTGSGTFLITIDLSTTVGSANGTGHVELDESGLCTATNSTDYTFTVSGTLDPVSGNLTLQGFSPNPGEFDAARTCTNHIQFGPDVLSWPAFYPDSGVTLPAKYGASTEGTVGGFIQYQVTLA